MSNQEPVPRVERVSAAIGLPEFLRQENVEGLLPGEIAYLFPSQVLDFDKKTGRVWVDMSPKINDENRTIPDYLQTKDRIAIMAVINEAGTTDYVLDATGVKAGDIVVHDDLLRSEYDGDAPDSIIHYRQRFRPPAAVAYKNLENEIELHGDPTFFDHLNYLIHQYDTLLGTNIEASTPITAPELPTKDPSQEDVQPQGVDSIDEI